MAVHTSHNITSQSSIASEYTVLPNGWCAIRAIHTNKRLQHQFSSEIFPPARIEWFFFLYKPRVTHKLFPQFYWFRQIKCYRCQLLWVCKIIKINSLCRNLPGCFCWELFPFWFTQYSDTDFLLFSLTKADCRNFVLLLYARLWVPDDSLWNSIVQKRRGYGL